MFVYETNNSLNVTFKGNATVENPEVVIKGFENGATLIVNGEEVVSVADAKEFENSAQTFVFEKGNKLAITFKGVAGMETPDVTLDETEPGVVNVEVNGTPVVLNYTDEGVTIEGASENEPAEVISNSVVETPIVEEVPEVVVTEETTEEESVEEEADAE